MGRRRFGEGTEHHRPRNAGVDSARVARRAAGTMRRLCAGLIVLLASLPWRASFGCGATSDCLVTEGSYRIRLPTNASGRQLGAVIYFHGWQQAAEDVMSDASLAATAERLGIALVALNGEQKTWSFPSSPTHHRDDFEYVHAVVDDLVEHFPIDRKRLLGAGFSQGASMMWYLACREPRLFAAFAPMSGAFWRLRQINVRHLSRFFSICMDWPTRLFRSRDEKWSQAFGKIVCATASLSWERLQSSMLQSQHT